MIEETEKVGYIEWMTRVSLFLKNINLIISHGEKI